MGRLATVIVLTVAAVLACQGEPQADPAWEAFEHATQAQREERDRLLRAAEWTWWQTDSLAWEAWDRGLITDSERDRRVDSARAWLEARSDTIEAEYKRAVGPVWEAHGSPNPPNPPNPPRP